MRNIRDHSYDRNSYVLWETGGPLIGVYIPRLCSNAFPCSIRHKTAVKNGDWIYLLSGRSAFRHQNRLHSAETDIILVGEVSNR